MNETDISRRGLIAGAAAATAAGTAAAVGGASSAGAAETARLARAGKADTVIMNGDVLVMDRKFKRAEALAIKGGKIQAVGDKREIRRLIGKRTEVINAAGGTVLPGINDSHVHLGGFATALPPFSYNVDAPNVAALVQMVAAAVAEAPAPDSWIRGTGWNADRMGATPTRHDLDPVSGDHPVILNDFSFHAVVVNTKVLQMAGITRDTVPPPGGVIEKDENGEPNGVLHEGASGLVRGLVPPFTEDEIAHSINVGIEYMHTQGITSITDPGIGLDQLARYAAKARAGELQLRLTALLMGGPTPAGLQNVLDSYRPLRDVDKRLLRVAGVKIMADGVPTSAQTAWLLEPYVDGSNGALSIGGATQSEQLANLQEMVSLATQRGFQIGTHATGDATINAVVNAYIKALEASGRRNLRHYVIHADLTPRSTLRKMARYDIGANMNATIKYLLGRTLDPVLGEERTSYQWPYRSALDAGVKVSSSSDAPVTGPNWFQGVMAARMREGMFGGVAGAAERISVKEALHTYTSTPAWQDKAGNWKGTLRPGKVADVAVVDGNVLTTHPRDLIGLSVAYTLFNGDVVYDAATVSGRQRAAVAAQRLNAFSHETSIACLEQGLCCCKLVDRLEGA